ncbi:MAG: KH domain-containing protein [Armatimonadetes bacterium]|nr:KH domain-containing protein [Armatimonadota bacterium]
MEPQLAAPEPEELEEPLTAGDVAADFVQDVVDAMQMDAEVELAENPTDGSWLVSVVGPESGDLIGKYGSGLNALQYLAGLVVLRQTGEHTRLVVDADSYRAKRHKALVDQALALAQEVAAAGQEAELDPLNAFERRIIHNALANHPEVVTYSEGVDPDRRVIIAPRPPSG